MVVIDVDGVKVQIVNRGGKPYARLLPSSVTNPSMAQAEMRLVFRRATEMARRLSAEEVARIVGGRVFRGNLIEMPDGKVLPKAAALVAHYMKGYTPRTRARRELLYKPMWRRVLDAKKQEVVEAVMSAVARAIKTYGVRRL